MKGRKAFSLVELLVVIAILGLLIGILMPALGRAKELSYRSVCTNHLKELTKGCISYATDSRDQGGDTARCLPVVSPAPTASNWYDSSKGNRACLWLLVSGGYVSTDIFICPAATTYKPAAKSDTKLAWNNCSYSFISMVDPTGTNRPAISLASPSFLGNLVLAADLNPRFKPDAANAEVTNTFADSNNNGWGTSNPNKNSLIHGRGEGQNIARADTSVSWSTTSTVTTGNTTTGVNATDCIYESTTAANDTDGTARGINGPNDVFLLP